MHRILFVRTDRIGDALMNLPALRVLRQKYPKAWIAWMASSAAAELLRGHPDLDEVMVVSESELSTPVGRWALWKKIRAACFDAILVSNPLRFFHFLGWAAGIPVRAGHDRKGALFLNHRLRTGQALLGLHEIERNLRLAACLGAGAWDGGVELPIQPDARQRMNARLADALDRRATAVAVHPGTSHPKKRWSAERFAEVCARVLRESDRAVVLIGGPEEAETAREIVRLAPGCVDWTGQTTLAELSAFFAHPQVSALVSSDSGPVHVAWIQKTPVVALYAMDLAGSDPLRWGPRDGVSEMIHKPMSSISSAEVFAALCRVWVRPSRKENA